MAFVIYTPFPKQRIKTLKCLRPEDKKDRNFMAPINSLEKIYGNTDIHNIRIGIGNVRVTMS